MMVEISVWNVEGGVFFDDVSLIDWNDSSFPHQLDEWIVW